MSFKSYLDFGQKLVTNDYRNIVTLILADGDERCHDKSLDTMIRLS
ncbi:hypothetical protein L248_0493 [Schleiferilactobacillus shenzhenensis LY-73]|uniref:Uncharacterized protein n=1 Tax=Schleiferilactobacillus shenzhenensis LY-73 TaxID=1231336 RepID=U4TL27_9LACO|nr:hypothetical protein L248_0493 [Schleiferilactobacillus shenzhenensis LY-73]